MKALVVYGGWEGHEPEKTAAILARQLRQASVDVEMADTLAPLDDAEKLAGLDLLVMNWTMGEIAKDAAQTVSAAVEAGLGVAGMHGGLGDAFRDSLHWKFIIGGQFVAHPDGIIDYRVHIVDHADPVTAGLKHFDMHSEQYYMHVDPSNHVLATTTFERNGCTMPVVWKRTHGAGRVFYSSLGHVAADLENGPEALTIITRGMLWAAGSRAAAQSK